MESNINLLAVVVAAVVAFAIGGLWYGPLFGKKWQKLVGLSDKQLEKGMAQVFGTAFVLTLIMAFNLAFFIGDKDAVFGLFAGFAAGFGWVAMAMGVNYLFEHRSFAFYVINAGYNVVILTVMGGIIGAF